MKPAALLLAAVGCALALAAAGCSHSTPPAAARPRGPSYALLQMNLCLSGLAGCYGRTSYPAVLDEAAARVRATHPDAVTVDEACSKDAALIARRTGYRLRFATVLYGGRPLRCIRPGGRGLFGDAVLTKAAVESSDAHAFSAQEGIERRVWLCVTMRPGVEVCTAHLDTRMPAEVAGNRAQ